MTVEILRYEAKWGAHAEWQECTETDYHAIRQSIHPHMFKARVIGIVEDPAGLLLPGPEGKYDSWREAAVAEKMKRIEIERELKALKAKNEQLENASLITPSQVALQAYAKEHFVRKHFCVACDAYTVVNGTCERDASHADIS